MLCFIFPCQRPCDHCVFTDVIYTLHLSELSLMLVENQVSTPPNTLTLNLGNEAWKYAFSQMFFMTLCALKIFITIELINTVKMKC